MARQELARFLRDRRHALDPEALGVRTAAVRRVLTVPDDDQQVVFVTAEPGTPTARALRQLSRGPARRRGG